MARKAQRVRVERGLYRAGAVWWACVTPQGQRTAAGSDSATLASRKPGGCAENSATGSTVAKLLPRRDASPSGTSRSAGSVISMRSKRQASCARERSSPTRTVCVFISRPHSAAGSSHQSRPMTLSAGTTPSDAQALPPGRSVRGGWESEDSSDTPGLG